MRKDKGKEFAVMMMVLASKSPRRREILDELNIDFEILTEEVDESSDVEDPSARAQAIAARKAIAVRDMLVSHNIDVNSLCIVGADTVVWCGGEFMGKPADRDDARRMIKLLSGKTHRVYTGIAVAIGGRIETDVSVSEVDFAPLDDDDIEDYISTDEPYDKAGAYAVQGKAALFIDQIRGDYLGIVGLSTRTLDRILRERFGRKLISMKKRTQTATK